METGKFETPSNSQFLLQNQRQRFYQFRVHYFTCKRNFHEFNRHKRKRSIQVKVSGLITIKDLNAVLILKKLMHETISLGQQKVFIQSHKHSFQGRFFSSVTLNSFDTKAFVCLQTEFSVLLIVFFPSSTYDEFCAEQKR